MENITPHMVNAWLWLGLLAFWLSVAAWSNRNVSHEGFAGRLQTVMPLAVAFLLMFYDRHRPLIAGRLYQLPPLEWAGVAATLAGVLFAVWARLHLGRYWSGVVALKEDHRIIRTGPYRLVRHPIYSGFALAALGTAISAATGDAFVGLILLIATFVFKLRKEERLLLVTFGEEYQQFMHDVPALVPGIY